MSNQDQFDVFDDILDEESQKSDQSELENQKNYKEEYLVTQQQIQLYKDRLKNLEEKSLPQISKTQLAKNCTLETIVKSNLNAQDHKIDITQGIQNPAKKYEFELDDFQKAAVLSIESNTSVLVAAHTSAGKTAVAEYVIAKCLANNQRVIYTSPIKALSNQKYRDLKKEFGQVGLVTGDNTIDENQTCLVMTTEILRNMFFRSNEIAKETAWIIFDEAHYLKDKDRGVIWEETIILAPTNVRYCLLSATAPNASELAQWIMKVKNLNCINVIYTDFRPTPLENFAYMSGDKKILLLKDIKGNLIEKNYQTLTAQTKSSEGQRKKQGNNAKDIVNIVKLIQKKQFYPAIIFAFSKKEVENLSKNISKKMNLLTSEEKNYMDRLFKGLIGGLNSEDQKLPQITALLDILKSGVGLHHGGMLPILKEIVEILFQSGIIKILISTETFSMGVNMPAKCVVFSTIRKWDGDMFRQLQGSEFVQMSGRAGRRGKDKKGIVITMLDQNTDVGKFWKMLKTQSKNDPLISQFSISYNMLINTLLMEGMEPEEMVQSSFKQFQYEIQSKKSQKILQKWETSLQFLDQEFFENNKQKYEDLMQLYDLQVKLKKNEEKLTQILIEPQVILNFMNIGRLFFVEGCGWVPMINISKSQQRIYIDFFIFLNYSKNEEIRKSIKCNCFDCIRKYSYTLLKDPKVITIPLDQVKKMSSIIVHMPTNLININEKFVLRDTIQKIIKQFEHNMPLMELITDIPIENNKIKQDANKLLTEKENLDMKFKEQKQKYMYQFLNIQNQQEIQTIFSLSEKEVINQTIQEGIENSKIYFEEESFNSLFKIEKPSQTGPENLLNIELESIDLLSQFSQAIKTSIEKAEISSVSVFHTKIEKMKQILKRLEYISEDEVPNQKGKIASLVFGADELLLTELLFSGHLRNLNSKQLDQLFSVFVNEEQMKGSDGSVSDDVLKEVITKMKGILEFFVNVFTEVELEDFNSEDYIKLNPSMFDIIEMWYDGKTFLELTQKSSMFEGSIIRNIKRLYELLKQIGECCQAIGNKDLQQKIEEGQQKLCRGIVFASSLYIN